MSICVFACCVTRIRLIYSLFSYEQVGSNTKFLRTCVKCTDSTGKIFCGSFSNMPSTFTVFRSMMSSIFCGFSLLNTRTIDLLFSFQSLEYYWMHFLVLVAAGTAIFGWLFHIELMGCGACTDVHKWKWLILWYWCGVYVTILQFWLQSFNKNNTPRIRNSSA